MEPRNSTHTFNDAAEMTEPTPAWRARIASVLLRPVTVALFGVALLGALALIYLNEVAGIASADAQLAALRTQQTRLERQEALLLEQLGEVTSPAYIDQRARALGLVPSTQAPTFIIRGPQP